MTEATAITSASREALHEIDGTIESLTRLLDDMRVEHARQVEEAGTLREELARMHEREQSLNEALTRLRHWLALDAEAMLSPGMSGLAGLEAGAEQLRAEADANRQLASAAQQGRDDAQATITDLRERLGDLTRRLDGVTAERDELRSRLQEHEALLKTAGLEIEFRPSKRPR